VITNRTGSDLLSLCSNLEIIDVETKVCADRERVYSHGFPNGGTMTQMLACKAADIFAAAVPAASTLTISQHECKPSRPISVMMINGTADSLVGYDQTAFAGGITVPNTYVIWATLVRTNAIRAQFSARRCGFSR